MPTHATHTLGSAGCKKERFGKPFAIECADETRSEMLYTPSTAVQHLQYLPFGEPFVDQRTTGYSERFRFTGKEKDEETGYGYFGARYMDHELMTMWLSVDPMADKYQQDIEELAYQMGERVREMFEGLAGIDLQGIVDKWLGIFREFGDDMTVVFSKIDESIDDMIRNMVMQAVFVQPLMQRLQKIIKDYEKQLRRQQGLGEDDIVDWTYANFREIAEAMRGEKEYAQTLYNQLVSELSAAGLDFGAASASDRHSGRYGFHPRQHHHHTADGGGYIR